MKGLQTIVSLLLITLTPLGLGSTLGFEALAWAQTAPLAPGGGNSGRRALSREQEQALRQLWPRLTESDIDRNAVPASLTGDSVRPTDNPGPRPSRR